MNGQNILMCWRRVLYWST